MDTSSVNTVVEHLGKAIIIHNYVAIDDEDFVEAIEYNVSDTARRAIPDQLLLLDITNAYITTEVLETFKKAAIDIKPYTKKIAVVGVRGIQKVFFKIVITFSKSNNIKSFETREEAMDWLVLP
jgi:hypothetical protein